MMMMNPKIELSDMHNIDDKEDYKNLYTEEVPSPHVEWFGVNADNDYAVPSDYEDSSELESLQGSYLDENKHCHSICRHPQFHESHDLRDGVKLYVGLRFKDPKLYRTTL